MVPRFRPVASWRGNQLLKVPLRSLKRSSGSAAPPFGLAPAAEVSDEELPHRARTVEETGCAFASAWNSEWNTGAPGEVSVAADADAIVIGVTVRASGNVER